MNRNRYATAQKRRRQRQWQAVSQRWQDQRLRAYDLSFLMLVGCASFSVVCAGDRAPADDTELTVQARVAAAWLDDPCTAPDGSARRWAVALLRQQRPELVEMERRFGERMFAPCVPVGGY